MLGLPIPHLAVYSEIMSKQELDDAAYDALVSGTCDGAPQVSPATEQTDNPADAVDSDTDGIPNVTNERKRNTYSELRELQRIMLDTARTDEMGTAKASAARVWRDLEILRMAKLGKPLCLSTTAKLEAPSKQASSPMISLSPTDQAQAA